MSRALRVPLAAALLAAPTVLAFFSGGYFGVTHGQVGVLAAALAWLLAALVLALEPRPFPQMRAGRVALTGLASLSAWTALSLAWSPVLDPGLADAERVALYLAAFLVGGAVLRDGPVRRTVTPALLAGVGIVCAYALATRCLPGIFEVTPGLRAGSRLEQPLTYWNALGALAAMGLVLAFALAGDATRPGAARAAAAAVAPALGLTLFLTISRGALAAALVGAVVLVALARDRRTTGAALLSGALVAALVALASRFPAVVELSGDDSARESEGLAVLALALAAGAGGALGQLVLIRAEARPGGWTRVVERRRPLAIAVALLAVASLAVGMAAFARGDAEPARRGVLAQDPSRLRTLETNRWRYWDVALESFGADPLLGSGVHGFAAEWLLRRDIDEAAQDAHSLYVETLGELGLPGFALLLAFAGGAAVALFRSRDAGWAAGGAVWLVHTGVDWDWEMPALTLVFVALAAAASATAASTTSAGSAE